MGVGLETFLADLPAGALPALPDGRQVRRQRVEQSRQAGYRLLTGYLFIPSTPVNMVINKSQVFPNLLRQKIV